MGVTQQPEEQATVGACLKRLRNEKNVSVADVAARMCLHTEVIEALEQDNYDNLPGPLYIHGYLSLYAKILDVPADELLAMYKKSTEAAPEQVIKKQKKWLHVLTYLALFILVLVILTLWRSRYALERVEEPVAPDHPVTVLEQPDTPPTPAPSTETGEAEQPLAPEPEPGPEPGLELEPETAQEAEPALEPLETPAPPPGTDTLSDSEPEAAVTYEDTTISAGAGPDTVTLVLSHDCWIEIFDAENTRIFYDLARAGQTLVLSGKAPLSVLLGNADAAAVAFNNMPFDITPHVTGIGMARFVLGAPQHR